MKTKSRQHTPKKTYFKHSDDEFDEESADKPTSVKWYDNGLVKDPKTFPTVSDEIFIALRDEAKKSYDADVADFNIKTSKTNSNYRWMKTVMSKGTVADKLAAYVVTIQDNPLYSLEQIRQLVGMVKVSKKKECVSVIQSLTELFLDTLLKPNTTLKTFGEQPLKLLESYSSGNNVTRRKYLINWYFESQIKEIYASFVIALNTVAHDTIEANKDRALGAIAKLLAGNPEQEKNLLAYLVNKLGDPLRKVASKAIYCLTQLLFKHPIRQGMVLNEVEKMLFRSNISTKAQYYALCFLSQFYLNHENVLIARKLIEVYFSFFKACIKKGDVNNRMMSALLMGVNRAYPYAKMEIEKIAEHITTIYRVVHIANFNVSLHALQILYQVAETPSGINDRFYSALYKKLADPNLTRTTHQAILLNLIYKSMLRDNEPTRIRTFVKRLLQISLMSQPSLACGILYLVSQVLIRKQNCDAFEANGNRPLLDAVYGDDDEDETYTDVKDENDVTVDEKAPAIDDADLSKATETVDNADEVKQATGTTGWYHCKVKQEKKDEKKKQFDPLARNPLYAGGEHAAYLELHDLMHHFHPTVALFAMQIVKGEKIVYSGDPLKDFVLIRFLDRFVFKNPKKADELKKPGPHPTFGQRKTYIAIGAKSLPINSTRYLDQTKNIPVDEMFMFSYLKNKRERKGTIDHNRKKDDDDDDTSSVCSEEFEEMLNKMGNKDYKDVDDDLDYLNELDSNFKKKSKSKKKAEPEDDDEETDIDDEPELSEDDLADDNVSDLDEDLDNGDLNDNEDGDEMNEDDEELFGDLDDDDEDIVFDEDEPEENIKGQKNRKMKKKNFDNVFASADEFASLLEDEGSSKYAPGGSNALSNADNAHVKQLDWEQKRNNWLSGYSKAVKGGAQKRPYNNHQNRKTPEKGKQNKKRKLR